VLEQKEKVMDEMELDLDNKMLMSSSRQENREEAEGAEEEGAAEIDREENEAYDSNLLRLKN
jgi:hypothetical protein